MAMATLMSDEHSPSSPASKRKRTPDAELEIDLSLPEPSSKRAKRQEKKSSTQTKKSTKNQPSSDISPTTPNPVKTSYDPNEDVVPLTEQRTTQKKSSEYSIWVGNLSFKSTRDSLREFLRKEGAIEGREIVRLHLPTTTSNTTSAAGVSDSAGRKAQNKGFAYIDFTSSAIHSQALQLSERLLDGRRVLIKDAKSFEGRPLKKPANPEEGGGRQGVKKEPSKRVFVGNLGFDVTKEELAEFFGAAGEVEDVFVATFEDSGKCKGFGWVRFATIEAASAAAKGYVFEEGKEEDGVENDDEIEDGDEGEGTMKGRKKSQRRKHFINRLHGRQLRCEFAEDAQTRYKKRFTKTGADKGSKDRRQSQSFAGEDTYNADGDANGDVEFQRVGQKAIKASEQKQNPKRDREQRREDRRKRHEKLDARHGKPTQTHPAKATGAIVAGAGRKMKFDD